MSVTIIAMQLENAQRLRLSGDKEQARQICERLLAQYPLISKGWFLLGLIYHEMGDLSRAAVCFDRINDDINDSINVLLARGKLEIDRHNYKSALLLYEQAHEIAPLEQRAYFGIGHASLGLRDYHRAVGIFSSLSTSCLDNPSVWINLANGLTNLSRYEEAEIAVRNGLKLYPDEPEGLRLLAKILQSLKRYEESLTISERLLDQSYGLEKFSPVLTSVFSMESELCRWDSFKEHSKQIIDLVHADVDGVGLFELFHIPEATLIEHFLCASKVAQGQMLNQMVDDVSVTHSIKHTFPLRVGFMSSDFRSHAVSHVFSRVLELFDHTLFEIHAYSLLNSSVDNDPLKLRIEKAVDYFWNVADMPSRQLAEKIRQDEIDVLVDLNGFTNHHHIQVFRYHPAPVTVNYLGFPSTLGPTVHDWILGDSFVTPIDDAKYFSEKIWCLPDSYMPADNARPVPVPESKIAVGLESAGFVFSCFDNPNKINPDVFDVWCEILKQVPNSTLWLAQRQYNVSDYLIKEAEKRGVSKERFAFAPMMNSSIKHQERMGAADLALDTWPYNMHATAVDTLWSGVPLLTLKGKSFPGRVAESILNAAGLADMVASNKDEYIAKAVYLATNPTTLAEIKMRVHKARQFSSLFDSNKMARSLGNAFIGMYEQKVGVKLTHECGESFADQIKPALVSYVVKYSSGLSGKNRVWVDIENDDEKIIQSADQYGYNTLFVNQCVDIVGDLSKKGYKAISVPYKQALNLPFPVDVISFAYDASISNDVIGIMSALNGSLKHKGLMVLLLASSKTANFFSDDFLLLMKNTGFLQVFSLSASIESEKHAVGFVKC